MSADENKNTTSRASRYPDDRGVGGILGNYQRSHQEPAPETKSSEHNNDQPEQAREETSQGAAAAPSAADKAQDKARVLYHLPKSHIAALDEIKAELKGHKGYSARDASYSAIVTQAIERYYTDLFPDREPPG